MTAKRYQAKRPVRLLLPDGIADRAVTTLDGTTLGMRLLSTGMVVPAASAGRVATRIVAASNAPTLTQMMADYICDGVADDVQINAALADGSTVYLSEGTFTLAAAIVLGSVRRQLRGMGMSATTLITVNAGGAPVNVGLVQLSADYCAVSDLTIDGNKANNAAQTSMAGVSATAAGAPTIQRVRVLNSAGYGITTAPAVANGIIRDCLIEGAATGGLVLRAASNQPLTVSGCTAKNNAQYGFYCDNGPVSLSDCQALSHSSYGFIIASAALATLSQCLAQGNAAGGFNINATTRTSLSNCQAISNTTYGFSTDATQTQFIGCTASGTTGGGNGFQTLSGAVAVLYNGCVSSSGVAGFHHASADRSTYIGCRAISNTSYGFIANAGAIQALDCSVYGVSGGGYGIYAQGGAEHDIVGCHIENIGATAILTDASVSKVLIANNAVHAAGLMANNGHWAILSDADASWIYGNTVRDGTGNRSYGAVAFGGNSAGSFMGHNDTYGAGVTAESMDTGTNSRLPVKSLLFYEMSTDLMAGYAIAANTWVSLISAQNFTVGSPRSIIEVTCNVFMLVGIAATAIGVFSRVVVDGVGYILGQDYTETTGFQNPFSSGCPLKFENLAAGVHTVRLDVYATAAATGYCRASLEHLSLEVMEYAR